MTDKHRRDYTKYGSEFSDGNTTEVDSEERYTHLQNNHRRLLGVTTALTEALENTVRGNSFDLEETLTECMKIYPELFTMQLKKPTKQRKPKKIYNTSVSEDVTDIAETESKIHLEIQTKSASDMRNAQSGHSNQEGITVDNDNNKSPKLIGPESDSCDKILSGSIQHQVSRASEVYHNSGSAVGHNLPVDSNCFDEMAISNNMSDTSPFLIQSPSRQSFSLHMSDTDASLLKSPHIVDYLPNIENQYVFCYPEAENVQNIYKLKPEKLESKKHRHLLKRDTEETLEDEMSCDNSFAVLSEHREFVNGKNEVIWPYEIIVQQKVQTSSFPKDTDLLIKMLPEMTFRNKTPNDPTERKTRNNSTSMSKSEIITEPAETRIIITQQPQSKQNQTTDNSRDPNHIMHNQSHSKRQRSTDKGFIVLDGEANTDHNVQDTSDIPGFKNVTIEKLQKLSTGLKVQSDVLQPITPDTNVAISEHNLDTIDENYQFKIISPRETIEQEETKNYYKTIKEGLAKGNVKSRATLIQSLRLKLIHTLAKERASLLISYAENDILKLSSEPTLLEDLIPNEIVNGWDLILQQMTLKFINTLSSTWKGRDYLTQNTNTIKHLHGNFFKKLSTQSTVDDVSKDMLIAIFHKLSIRQNQQTILINAGAMEKVLHNIMEHYEIISNYHLRHSLGLLINLCVSNHSRQHLEPMAVESLTMLTSLLKCKDRKIVPYATRLIYILMSNEKFHLTAKGMKLTTTLNETILTSKTRTKLQMEILKGVIEQTSPHKNLHGEEIAFLNNIEAELDELEEEVEAREPRLSSAKSDQRLRYENIPEKQVTPRSADISSGKMQQSKDSVNLKKNSNIPRRKNNNKKTPKVAELTRPQAILSEKDSKSHQKQTKTKYIQEIKKEAKIADEVHKLEKNNICRPKINRKVKRKIQHEIDEKNEFSTNYTLLQEALSNIIDDQAHAEGLPHFPPDALLLGQHNHTQKNKVDLNIEMDDSTTFVVLCENEADSTADLKDSFSNSKHSKVDNTKTSGEPLFQDSSEISESQKPALEKSRPTSKAKDPISQSSRKHSLFSQEGRISAMDYDYCEQTKQIQTPVQHNNIFKDCRQSPYRSKSTGSYKDTTVDPVNMKDDQIHIFKTNSTESSTTSGTELHIEVKDSNNTETSLD